MRVRNLRWVVGALASVTLAACSGQPLAASTTPGRPNLGAGSSARHLPIEAYMLTAWQSVEFDHVTDSAIRGCMRRYGWDYPVAKLPSRDSTAVASRTVMFRRYGVTDAASVRIWGYHLPRDPRGPGSAAPQRAANPADLPPAARRVLLGTAAVPGSPAPVGGTAVPEGGCVGEAHRLIRGDTSSPQGPGSAPGGLVARIKQESFAASMADPRVTAVFARWSACMAARGFRATDPLHAADRLASLTEPAPTRAEIDQAEADVACKKRTDLVGVWFAAESAYQRAAIDRNATALASVAAARDREAADIGRLMSRYAS